MAAHQAQLGLHSACDSWEGRSIEMNTTNQSHPAGHPTSWLGLWHHMHCQCKICFLAYLGITHHLVLCKSGLKRHLNFIIRPCYVTNLVICVWPLTQTTLTMLLAGAVTFVRPPSTCLSVLVRDVPPLVALVNVWSVLWPPFTSGLMPDRVWNKRDQQLGLSPPLVLNELEQWEPGNVLLG